MMVEDLKQVGTVACSNEMLNRLVTSPCSVAGPVQGYLAGHFKGVAWLRVRLTSCTLSTMQE